MQIIVHMVHIDLWYSDILFSAVLFRDVPKQTSCLAAPVNLFKQSAYAAHTLRK